MLSLGFQMALPSPFLVLLVGGEDQDRRPAFLHGVFDLFRNWTTSVGFVLGDLVRNSVLAQQADKLVARLPLTRPQEQCRWAISRRRTLFLWRHIKDLFLLRVAYFYGFR